MRIALVGGLVGAAAAAARDIPVYREYTVPISFAAEADREFAAADVAAPDLAAGRELRDGQSREAMLGKETILDLGLGRASAPRGDAAPVPGKLTPPAAPERRRGGKKEDSDRNWLVSSLTLPTLGQTASNAAAAVIARDNQESSRGWLVDDVARAATGAEMAQEQWRQEREGNDSYAREAVAAAEAAADAKTLSPSAAPLAEAAAKRIAQARTAAAGPDSGRPASSWSARADGGTGRSGWEPGSAAAGGMSRTRQLVAEYSAGGRPDFAALRASLVQAAPTRSVGDNSLSANRFGPDPASGYGHSTFSGNPATLGASWQGGWRSAGSGAAAPLRIEPLPAPIVPAAAAPRPAAASGGYKPAWY